MSSKRTVKPGIGSSTNPSPRRILLIEDNEVNRQMLNDYLVYCGFHVYGMGDGAELFEALANFQPHLILLDLKLPDIDGYTLLQLIKQRADSRHLPVIVVSAFAFRADQQRALRLGANRYFVKPVNLVDLTQAIEEELFRETPGVS